MLNHLSPESRDPSYVGSAMCPECSRKDWRGKFRWLHSRESSPEIIQVLVDWLHLRPCFVPSGHAACRSIWDICWPQDISNLHMIAVPATLSQGRIQSVRGKFSVIFSSQASFRVHCCTVREMKSTSQYCCDKTLDGKIALHRECCFSNCTKSWWI